MPKNFSAPLAPEFIITDEWCLSIEPFSRTAPPPPQIWGALLPPPPPPPHLQARHAKWKGGHLGPRSARSLDVPQQRPDAPGQGVVRGPWKWLTIGPPGRALPEAQADDGVGAHVVPDGQDPDGDHLHRLHQILLRLGLGGAIRGVGHEVQVFGMHLQMTWWEAAYQRRAEACKGADDCREGAGYEGSRLPGPGF